MRTLIVLAAIGLAFSSGHPASFTARAADDTILAWIRFDDAQESYADVPYLWLGKVDINLAVDVKPAPGHVLRVRWGSKNDVRGGVVSINGHDIPISSGGYDGFEWLDIPVPQKILGDRYEIVFRQGSERAGFLSEVRLTAPATAAAAPQPDLQATSHKIAGKSTPASRPEAFPLMRPIWDGPGDAQAASADMTDAEAAFRQAERNGRRANEQFYRCRKFVDGWLAQSDPTTGLIPRNLTSSRDIWNAKDSAADNYPFMVLTCALTDEPLFRGRMLDMLHTETRLTSRVDRLPDTWSFSKQAFSSQEPNLDSIIFGSSEYVKDGLLPLTEWLGDSPWRERMLGIVDDIWKHAPVETPHGKIPSTNVEVNGEMLQALSRIYWMTGDEKYLDWAVRLGDYYLLGDQHPTRNSTSLRLRDHGCEIVSGLSELYLAVHFARPDKKQEYRQHIHAMFDRILEIARDSRGMLYNTVDPQSGEHQPGICDTWGYNYNGIYAVYMIDDTPAYRQAVRHVLSNLQEHLTDYHWGSADEYADSIEGAINLYNREPLPEAAAWIDTEIRDMWANQRADGVVEGWHGDGNSARTAIMYALWKTQGITVTPWRADVRFGAVRRGDTLYISLTSEQPWTGKLVFDTARHKTQMHLPIDYPRINQFPEWFTADSDSSYAVDGAGPGGVSRYTGRQLQEGILIKLSPGVERRLTVSLAGE